MDSVKVSAKEQQLKVWNSQHMLPTPRNLRELDELVTAPSQAVVETVKANPGSYAVLGAGGKMGFHLSQMLTRALREAGRTDSVTAISRFGSDTGRAPFEAAGIPMIAADLSDSETLASLPDFDNIFYLAGVKFGTASDSVLLTRMNVVMPRKVARRYADARIVALSSGCVYSFSTPESGGSHEESETEPPGIYAMSCLAREASFAAEADAVCVIRLNYSVELRYGVLVDIAQRVWQQQPVNAETAYVNVIWQGDAVDHICQALNHVDSPPTVLNVAGAETLRVREVAEKFATRFNRPARLEGAEQPTAWLSNAVRAHRLFGAPKVTAEQMIDWIADWVENNGETLDKPTRFEARDGVY